MKSRWHVLPCGAMYNFKEHDYEDLAKKIIPFILTRLSREELEKLASYEGAGRKPSLQAQRWYTKFVRKFWEVVITELMESNRVSLNPQITLFIGAIQENKNRIAKARKKKRVYFQTGFKRYGIVLEGMKTDYYFRMKSVRRKELYNRIRNGQNFLDTLI